MSEEANGKVLVTRRVGAATGIVTIHNPARRNALSARMAAELVAAIDALESDQDINSIVVTGAAGTFCAGGDFADLLAAREEPQRLAAIYSGFVRILRCRLPTVAAVNGPAVGAGLNLALACDVRIASAAARFDTRFLGIRLHPGGGHTWMLTRAVGPATATRLLLFGAVVDGWEAERLGLVERCVGTTDVVEAAVEMAGGAAGVSRELLLTAKDTLRAAAAPGAEHSRILELEYDRQLRSLHGMKI